MRTSFEMLQSACQPARAATGHERQKGELDPKASGSLRLGQGRFRVVGALDVERRAQLDKQAIGGRFGEDDDEVDGLERGDQLRSLDVRDDWPAGLVDGAIGGQGAGESVAARTG